MASLFFVAWERFSLIVRFLKLLLCCCFAALVRHSDEMRSEQLRLPVDCVSSRVRSVVVVWSRRQSFGEGVRATPHLVAGNFQNLRNVSPY